MKQCGRGACFQRLTCDLDRCRHQISVRGDVEQFLAVMAPTRAGPAAGLNRPAAVGSRKRLYIDFIETRFIGLICYPPPVR